jgi:hypothetical protein
MKLYSFAKIIMTLSVISLCVIAAVIKIMDGAHAMSITAAVPPYVEKSSSDLQLSRLDQSLGIYIQRIDKLEQSNKALIKHNATQEQRIAQLERRLTCIQQALITQRDLSVVGGIVNICN